MWSDNAQNTQIKLPCGLTLYEQDYYTPSQLDSLQDAVADKLNAVLNMFAQSAQCDSNALVFNYTSANTYLAQVGSPSTWFKPNEFAIGDGGANGINNEVRILEGSE